jgi:hypothetical protein
MAPAERDPSDLDFNSPIDNYDSRALRRDRQHYFNLIIKMHNITLHKGPVAVSPAGS